MKLNKAYISGLVDAQIKPYDPPVSVNKKIVKVLKKK
jgi:hypothetical protein